MKPFKVKNYGEVIDFYYNNTGLLLKYIPHPKKYPCELDVQDGKLIVYYDGEIGEFDDTANYSRNNSCLD